MGNKTDDYLEGYLQTDRSKAFLYHVPFCLRRLALVLCFFTYKNSTHLEALYGTIGISTVYIIYFTNSKPHIDDYFNLLELFNEIAFILIAYTFIGFVSSEIEPILNAEAQWQLGYVSIGLIGVVYAVNFCMMILVTIKKIQWMIR